MIRDVQGTYVFLELNPAGQWAWLEMELGLPIAAAIADVLCRGADNREAVASG